MGALIILHGLFLLSCDTQTKQCKIMVGVAPDHVYKVGVNLSLVDLPVSTKMVTTLKGAPGNNADNDNIERRILVLDGTQIRVVEGAATMMVTVPMPDAIYGANRLRVDRDSILGGMDTNTIRGDAQRVAVAETVVLDYEKDAAFDLIDGTTKVASSKSVKGRQVLAFYSWPADCGIPADHSHALDGLLQTTGGKKATFNLTGQGATMDLDDPGSVAFGLPDSVMRPPCIQKTQFRRFDNSSQNRTAKKAGQKKPVKEHDDQKAFHGLADVTILTATETGCGSIVVFNP